MSVLAEPVAGLLVAGIISAPPKPGLLGKLDRYELLRVLGQGGMGIVFLARDTVTDAKVAIKLPRHELAEDTELVGRFLREVKRLQELKHPNLVSVLDARQLKRSAFFVMPYFDRGSLAQRIQPGVPLSREVILEILLPVAEALKVIHSGGFTHRDIKPGNILLGSDGSVCLADFGLARTVLNDSAIQPGKEQCEGTPPYMSPQMAAGEKEDTRCDIYAFGALLYEMLTGQPPYQGQTTREIRDRVLAGPPKPIAEVNPEADAGLVSVAQGAMAREQRDRYANMGDLAEDLVRIRAGRPPVGSRGLALRRPLSFVFKNRIGRILVATGAAAAVLVMVWVLWPHASERGPKNAPASQPPTSLQATNSQWVVRSFSLPHVLNWNLAVPVNWGDRPDQELLVLADNRLLAVSASGRILKFWPLPAPFPAELQRFLITERQGIGNNGVLVSWTQGTNLGIQELNENFFAGKQFTALGAERDPRDTGVASDLHPLCLLTAGESRDGRKKVIAAIQTNFSKKPRGLCCFDYETGQMEWQRLVGPMLYGLEFLDLDGDGFNDFICGSSSLDNGNVAEDGTDDSHSYVFAWSNVGKLLWSTNLSGTNSGAEVVTADLGGNGHKDIVAWVHRNESSHGLNDSVPSKIVQLGDQGQVLNYYQPGTCLQSCLAADLNNDGRAEIICSDCQGVVHILGPNLVPLKISRVFDGGVRRPGKVDRAEVRLIAVRPFLQAGRLNLLVQCWMTRQDSAENLGDLRKPMDPRWDERFEILVLDTDLNPVARYDEAPQRPISDVGWASLLVGWTVRAADMDGDGLDEILSLRGHVEILKMKR
jgi:serine/threonine protein kinase